MRGPRPGRLDRVVPLAGTSLQRSDREEGNGLKTEGARKVARRPIVVHEAERAELAEQQTPGMTRQQAFVGDDRWVGFIRTEPGKWSGWHHHGENDTYLFALRGQIELESGEDGSTVAAGATDFVYVPAGLVHRERTAPGAPGEAVLVRIGRGPTVVKADGPARD